MRQTIHDNIKGRSNSNSNVNTISYSINLRREYAIGNPFIFKGGLVDNITIDYKARISYNFITKDNYIAYL